MLGKRQQSAWTIFLMLVHLHSWPTPCGCHATLKPSCQQMNTQMSCCSEAVAKSCCGQSTHDSRKAPCSQCGSPSCTCGLSCRCGGSESPPIGRSVATTSERSNDSSAATSQAVALQRTCWVGMRRISKRKVTGTGAKVDPRVDFGCFRL